MSKYGVSCLYPEYKINPYTHQYFLARCNKCSACSGQRHLKYVGMMEEERKSNRYAYFCTLNYSDYYVPKLYFSPDRRWLYNARYGICVPNDSIKSLADLHWIQKKKYVEFCYYPDFQKFIKRFRQNIIRQCPPEERTYLERDGKKVVETFRYYGVSELGPFTVRPHFHCILYFNNRWLSENFERLFYESWSVYDRVTHRRTSLGPRSQCRYCSGNEDHYTAAYCDAIIGIPASHLGKAIKPRHSYSRSPTLGSLRWTDEALSQKLHSGAYRDFIRLDEKGEPVYLQVPQSVKALLFPKLPSFNSLSSAGRAKSYGIYGLCASQWTDGVPPTYTEFSWFCRYYYRDLLKIVPELSDYLSRNNRDSDKISGFQAIKRPFYQLYLACKRFNENLIKYGLSSQSYLKMIEDFYSLQNYYQLKDWYEFLERVSQTEDVRPFYSLYLGVGEQFKAKHPLSSSLTYRSLKALSERSFKQRTKNKKERDYQLRGNAVEYSPEKYIDYCKINNCTLWQTFKNKCVT